MNEYWWEVGGDYSFSPWLIQTLLYDYSFINTDDEFYVGETDIRKAVADIKKGVTNYGNPTIVITSGGTHAKLVKGGSWQQLPNYQPTIEYITTADPQDYGTRNDQVGYWVQYVGAGDSSGGYIRTIGAAGQRGQADEELDEFDYWGGTYYGDEDPPDGCAECPPMGEPQPTSWLKSLLGFFASPQNRVAASVSAGSNRYARSSRQPQRPQKPHDRVGPEQKLTHPVRKFIYVPKPYTRQPRGVLENLLAGFSQTNLRHAEGWSDLDDLIRRRAITADRIDRVESRSGLAAYWLVTLAADGQTFAQALVSDTGWLLSVMRAEGGQAVGIPRSAEWASGIAAEVGYGHGQVRLVHMANNLTRMSASADYDPFWEVTVPGLAPLFVSQDGSAFVADQAGDGVAFWTDGTHRFKRIR